MSLTGIGTYAPRSTPLRPATPGIGGRVEQGRPAPAQQAQQQPALRQIGNSAAPAAATLPAEAPQGTDPELWSVLTGEERAFFARAGSLGPLTYGRATAAAQAPTPPAVRGGRLDVRG